MVDGRSFHHLHTIRSNTPQWENDSLAAARHSPVSKFLSSSCCSLMLCRVLLVGALAVAVTRAHSTHAPVWHPDELPVETNGSGHYEFTLYNHWGTEDYVNMFVGSPPQLVRIALDTVSTDLAVFGTEVPHVGGHHLYNHLQSTTYRFDGRNVTLRHKSSGFLVQDTVTINSASHDAISVDAQYLTEINDVSSYRDLFKDMGIDGSLGLGPSYSQSVGSVPTLIKSLMNKHAIQKPFAGLWMPRHGNGKFYLGGMPSELESTFQSKTIIPVDSKHNAWGFNINKITVGEKEIPLRSETQGVSDEPTRQPYGTLDNMGMMWGPQAAIEAIADALGGEMKTVPRMVSVSCGFRLPNVTFWNEHDYPITISKDDYILRQISEDECLTFFIHERNSTGADWDLGVPVFYSHFFGFLYGSEQRSLMMARR